MEHTLILSSGSSDGLASGLLLERTHDGDFTGIPDLPLLTRCNYLSASGLLSAPLLRKAAWLSLRESPGLLGLPSLESVSGTLRLPCWIDLPKLQHCEFVHIGFERYSGGAFVRGLNRMRKISREELPFLLGSCPLGDSYIHWRLS